MNLGVDTKNMQRGMKDCSRLIAMLLTHPTDSKWAARRKANHHEEREWLRKALRKSQGI